jgi:hypothetical protein
MNNKIYAFIQMYNELSNGHLQRCLENCKKWADDIIIYDDNSTDDSVNFALKYTKHIILGQKNELSKETYHKQQLLEYIHNMDIKPNWILWIDCDEIVDRNTILNLKQFCNDNYENDIDAYAFQQINLWRGQRYYRTDGYFYKKEYDHTYGWFVRLWKYISDLKINTIEGYDQILYPINLKIIERCDFKIIHYGFSDYKQLMKHIGVHNHTKKELIGLATGYEYLRLANEGIDWAKKYVINNKGIPNMFLNEMELTTEYLIDDYFPEDNIPTIQYEKPKGFKIDELKTYDEL